jgi:flagellar assembly protein FliH
MSSLPLAALGGSAGFRLDPRFAFGNALPADPADPVAQAWSEGHATALAEAQAEAASASQAERAARGRIELSLARLDAELSETLRRRLLDTVTALCETALAPMALDREALTRRVAKAVAMLARADDDKLLRLHPADHALIADRLPAGLEVHDDPALERGSLRLETASGGVEDGPAHWRRAIAEALAQC